MASHSLRYWRPVSTTTPAQKFFLWKHKEPSVKGTKFCRCGRGGRRTGRVLRAKTRGMPKLHSRQTLGARVVARHPESRSESGVPHNMATKPAGATQQFVPVKEIRNGTIILKDGRLSRGAYLFLHQLRVEVGRRTTRHHARLPELPQYALDFSIQMVINSRKMDLRPYLALLKRRCRNRKPSLCRFNCMNMLNSYALSPTTQTS